MSAINNTKDTLTQCLLYFSDEVSNFADKLGFDVVSKAPVSLTTGVAVKLGVERVPSENLLEGTLELIRKQFEQLFLDFTKDLAELYPDFPVNFCQTCTHFVTDDSRKATSALVVAV